MAVKSRSREKPVRRGALRTRVRLLDAGRKAFAAKGLGGASLREDILVRAGVSSGSFYHQFADKEDLLVEVLRCDGAAILDMLHKRRGPGGADPGGRARDRDRLLHALFEMADRHPEFVKIYVREYHSDSARVRRQIRRHRDQTIAHVRVYYEGLAELTGLPLDAERIATLLSVQSFALINYYLEFAPKRRREARERLIASMVQLGTGGILAMRRPEPNA
jgi:AcrR family transcriptional regulator